MQIKRERLRKTLDAPSWRDCLRTAREHAEIMEFEASVNICLDYLHNYLVPPTRPRNTANSFPNLKIFFACGGNSSRWNNFLALPKQMVDTGDGIPLIQRTINQFSSCFEGGDFYVITRQYDGDFSSVEGAKIIKRYDSIDRPVLREVLEYADKYFACQNDILCIYGDVYFSDGAIQKIKDHISCHNEDFALFGRKKINSRFGNSGGEDFAVYSPHSSRALLLEYHRFLERLYIGTPLHKYSTWELISLISALKKDDSSALPYPALIGGKTSFTYQELAQIRHSKEFHSRHWIEIDDETEDFDFPCEYIERIFRHVAWVGTALEQFSI